MQLTYSSDGLIASKTTTQHAPLEKFLTVLRTKKILPYVHDACVLDFGCGAHLKTLRTIGSRARARYGIDSVFKGKSAHKTADGITIAGSFSDLQTQLRANKDEISCVVSLACFEHLETHEFPSLLKELHDISRNDAVLVGTVPTPLGKPVLEFLSYKLKLIDPSQIEDHKVYYDRVTLTKALQGTGWELSEYRTFQFGMNSFFVFKKR